jgi:2-polyprenyl-3-methyl-5-hydroxy-6-metoxy-1,4-benzoquinol methylase
MAHMEPPSSLSAGAKVQLRSAGTSPSEIKQAALARSRPQTGLEWIDVGGGTGEFLRVVRDQWEPASLTSVDVLPWLDADLRSDVEEQVGDALDILPHMRPADRVVIIEALEHVEAPWRMLRLCARLVRPGGRLVVTTPSIATLRHRLELLLTGRLTSFRPEAPQHLTPVLPHVIASVLAQEGMTAIETSYTGSDIIPFTGGRSWPDWASRASPRLLSISVVIAATRSGLTAA